MSLVALLCIVLLGAISNYFFQTGKVLGIIINGERVHNNTFQEGVECYYKFQNTGNPAMLDSSISLINRANLMAYNIAIVDQLLQLPKEKYIEIFYNSYKEAYNYDRNNAYLMCSRIKLLLTINKAKMGEVHRITSEGFDLGEVVRHKLINLRKDPSSQNNIELEEDFRKIRVFYADFATVITSLNDFANNLLFWGIVLIVLMLIVTLWTIATLISRSVTQPVQLMVDNFQIIARGNLNSEIEINTTNEIGQLASSFREIQSSLRHVIEYTKKVADGDYSQPIAPRSDEDELSIALNKMVVKLKESYDKSVADSWFKTGINEINEKLSGDQTLNDLASHALTFTMDFLHSQLGSLHLYMTDYYALKLISSSGFDSKKLKDRIKLNEGILGQAAMKKELIILSDIPADVYVSFSSVGSFVPKQLIVSPLVFNEVLVGVLEIASLTPFTELEIEFLKQASEIIAINISSATNLLKTNELLLKTQEQASELQVQQEELRVANEELTEHTKVLTESEKRLQVQQEELRVANEELEERTRQLELQKEDIGNKNKELTETKEILEQKASELQLASQYKSEFLANMSHELRTPLNSLLILSNLLANNKKGNLTPDQVQSAQIIHKSGNDLLLLINEVLDLSKIEAGKMTLEFAQVETIEIKDEIISTFEAVANDRQLDFTVNIEPEFPQHLETDRYRLMQILRNLLSNAFKFTKEGRVNVQFYTPSSDTKFSVSTLSPENTCCIKVSDSGVGIPDEKLNSIFEAFQQADGSISRRYGGTGLGLSISRELIKMLGGEIQLESKVNEGSTFYVYLPLKQITKPLDDKEDDVTEASLLSKENSINEETVVKLKPLPFFLADDRDELGSNHIILVIHPSEQQSIKYMQQVRAKNFKVIVASSITDGIQLAEVFHPKAVMLAVELANDAPSYNLLKAHPFIKKLPIHIITPIEYEGANAEDELMTLETIVFADALKSLENEFISPSKRILLVEDDVATRQIVKELFSELDIHIVEVGFAEDAFRILEKERFDCVILDLGLPDYSGKDLLEKLKSNQIPIPKIIVYTGKEISKDEHRNLSSYTNAIILKGLKSDERLMDEVTLFLHQVSKTMPKHKAKTVSLEEEVLFKGKKILVVDDEIRNVFALAKMLEEREIEVFEAENGEAAIELLKAHKEIDLVFMDVMMPVMDGYEAIGHIRNIPEIKEIPIICLTAKAMKEDHDNALMHGANDYLSKPINEEKLFAMLKIWLYKN